MSAERFVPRETLVAQLRWRYATKRFDPAKKIPEEDWQALVQALVLSPSSYGLQPWKFFLVADPRLKESLPALSWGQTQPAECSHYVVLARRAALDSTDVTRLIDSTATIRGVQRATLQGFEKMLLDHVVKGRSEGWLDLWLANQIYIALGTLMAAAAVLGIDSCPMEGIDVKRYDELLDLPSRGYTTTVACALGYRAGDDRYADLPKVRYPAGEVVEII